MLSIYLPQFFIVYHLWHLIHRCLTTRIHLHCIHIFLYYRLLDMYSWYIFLINFQLFFTTSEKLPKWVSVESYFRGLTLWWRHNGQNSVSNHQPYDCLLNCLFRRRSKKTFKLRATGLCASPHKCPVTRKIFPFDDVIMTQHASPYDVFCVRSRSSSAMNPHPRPLNHLVVHPMVFAVVLLCNVSFWFYCIYHAGYDVYKR